jgi:FkbM family methyltransferase
MKILDSTNLFLDPSTINDSESAFAQIDKLMEELDFDPVQKAKLFSGGVHIWGSAEVARRIVRVLSELEIPLLGVFDSNPNKVGSQFEGFTIEAPREVRNFVIVCSYHAPQHLIEAKKILGDLALSAWDLLALHLNSYSLPWNNLRNPSSLSDFERDKLLQVGSRCDEDTQEEFWREVAARHFVGINAVSGLGMRSASTEYFVPEVTQTNGESVFLDLGAYTGDTLDRFFAQSIDGLDNRKAIAIEADKSNYQILLNKYSKNRNIHLLNAAINSTSGIIPFSESSYSIGSSALFFEANTIIPAVTIDDIFDKQSFSHVKFDIEGFERIALAGASKAIKSSGAVWSVASYHLYDDFWELPSFFPEEFKIHVSRHAPLPWDTTMHFYLP